MSNQYTQVIHVKKTPLYIQGMLRRQQLIKSYIQKKITLQQLNNAGVIIVNPNSLL